LSEAEPTGFRREASDRVTIPDENVAELPPHRVGRYTLMSQLGEGGFGRVHLARDEELGRLVAIKLPKSNAFSSDADAEDFLAEARFAARLKHPAIVMVHDIGRDASGLVFIVQEYIEGTTLLNAIQRHRISVDRAVRIATRVAEALQAAHLQGLVHRDLKPSNILLDQAGEPHVTDFGLAIQENGQRLRSGEVAGTPVYMAPEQVRGETHRLDGRTDLWGLGVVFYELLTSKVPFDGSRADVFEAILRREPKPPRQVDGTIPRELERICLRCLSKRMSDRYSSATDLIADLGAWREARTGASSGTDSTRTMARGDIHGPRTKVVPKGLRSFDARDSDFFLDLLPGPRDREGLPEILRFWKSKLEATDPDATFRVGLLYGPSGCGKSSLVRAGLIPRLSKFVKVVYVESSHGETEARLGRGLRKVAPDLPETASLTDLLLSLREGQGRPLETKVVVVLDQFEQWLHAKGAESGTELAEALLQCDGGSIQCLLMVRDDFGLSAMRLLHDLEIQVVEGWNYGIVDRFDARHAAKVLTMFGRAFDRLPEGPLTASQERFVAQVVDSLKEKGKVTPIRLSLFADMFQGRPWDTSVLKRMGGAEGIGLAFLEESIGDEAIDPRVRSMQPAARRLLKALLPESTTDLKGRMLSRAELLAATGQEDHPREFEELIGLLHDDLRLIMPGDPAHGTDSTESIRLAAHEQAGDSYYQLTHDYLVPVLKRWLTSKQRETTRGRAELLLEDRVALWSARPERRSLPSPLEWALIRLFTDRSRWDANQARMMRVADRLRFAQLVLAAGLVTFVVLVGQSVRHRVAWEQRQVRAETLASLLFSVEKSELPPLLDSMRPDRSFWQARIVSVADDRSRPVEQRIRAHLALVENDPGRIEYLLNRLLEADAADHRVIARALSAWPDRVSPRYRAVISDPKSSRGQRLRAAGALVGIAPDDPALVDASNEVARAILGEEIFQLNIWVEELEPIRRRLVGPMVSVFREPSLSETNRKIAADLIARFGRDDPETLAGLALDAGPRPFSSLWTALAAYPERTAAVMRAVVDATSPVSSAESERSAPRKAVAAIALLRLGEPGPAWTMLRSGPDPMVRTWLIERLRPWGASQEILADRLSAEVDATARQAILLALGGIWDEPDYPRPPQRLVEVVASLFSNDPEPAVHAGAEWLLRKWGHADRIDRAKGDLRGKRGGRWSVDGEGHTMIVVPGPLEFSMGSPESEPLRDNGGKPEILHQRRIGRTFAVSDREVSLEQVRRGPPPHPRTDPAISPDSRCPATFISWYDAARYCRWLSELEGIPPEQMCYPPVEEIKPGMTLPADGLERTGYRLPTEAEWECVCRAGTETAFHFGGDPRLLAAYGWYMANSNEHVHPGGGLKPNAWGFFDLHGNAIEWCHDPFGPYPVEGGKAEDVVWAWQAGDRVLRGGYYRTQARNSRSAKREPIDPESRRSIFGFRIARTIPR
jgi:serine/threonine protein kinase/formylglycine-generating enzyme required for sulfatase activity